MDILLTKDNDLDLIDNRIKLTSSSSDLIRQRLRNRLSLNKGEWKFNLLLGLPWVTSGDSEQILGKVESEFIDSKIKAEILKEDGVVKINSYVAQLNAKERIYSISCFVELIDNTTVELFERMTF